MITSDCLAQTQVDVTSVRHAYEGAHIVRLLTSGRTNNRGRNPIVCFLIPGWLCV
jgi:hypothetical protein